MQSFFLAVIEEPNLINELSVYKITQAIIEGYIADIQEYKELRSIVKSEKGQAENATKQRDKVLEELEFYVDKIRTIAKISLADSPQLLEELNVKVK
jgi:SPX domain protein involved in polyphosphate accumulation